MKLLGYAVILGALAACGSSGLDSHLSDVHLGSQIDGAQVDWNEQNEADFSLQTVDGELIEVIPEFAGKFLLHADGRAISYELGEKSFQAGVVGKGGITLCQGDYAEVCDLSFALKRGEDAAGQEGFAASANLNLIQPEISAMDSLIRDMDGNRAVVKDLLPFVLPSPNQEDAGSCLYMASTGAMEILLNQNPATRDMSYDGDADLSERFLMNSGISWNLDNWLTDSVLIYNHERGGALNKDYRYTKGHYKKSQTGINKPAEAGEAGASYGTSFNWINSINSSVKAKKVALPKIKRKVIYSDPAKNQWNTGIMNWDVVTKIKRHLDTKESPVLFVYNHFGYWHAVVILGYNDDRATGDCPFVRQYVKSKASDPRQADYVEQVKKSMAKNGGCRDQGVFYVRDSIYEGDPRHQYNYDLSEVGEETPYSKPVVEHSYEWALYLGNHAYTVELDD